MANGWWFPGISPIVERMALRDPELWRRLVDYRIGPADAALAFRQRLGRENRWADAFTERVILEYKRFCYLAATAEEQVTPSDAVDQAWHLHLTYSRDYWDRFCPDVLRRPLHHGPTEGGPVENERFYEQYARTLRAYEMEFGSPPADVWPPAKIRFREDLLAFRLKPSGVIILPRKAAIFAGVALGSLLLGAGWLIGRF